MLHFLLVALFAAGYTEGQRYLAVSGNELRLNGEKVFLSGMNIAWHSYGNDFGEGRYQCCSKHVLEDFLRSISENDGNSIRIWIHTDGRLTPVFDHNGFVSRPDHAGTFIHDLADFLDAAYDRNILVTLVLWNGAERLTNELQGLLWDDDKLQSYIDNVLVPMVQALRGKVALAAWEVMNEPEGSVQNNQFHNNPCFDTRPLAGSGAGWTGANIPMQRFLRFINRQIAAIKQHDGKALATIGSWNEAAQTDNIGNNARNYYKDTCLQQAGGYSSGTIDFYQMHTYEWQGSYSHSSPMLNSNYIYNLDKPNVIGEFSQDGGDGRDITVMMNHLYNTGYAGAWTWQANGGGHHSDDFNTQARGTRHLRGRTSPGGRIDIELQ